MVCGRAGRKAPGPFEVFWAAVLCAVLPRRSTIPKEGPFGEWTPGRVVGSGHVTDCQGDMEI